MKIKATSYKQGPRKRQSKKRKVPLTLVFDEEARKEFLTGFRKRKLQRKKQAQEDLDKKLKEEKRRIKNEAKQAYKKMVVSNRDIPEIQHIFENQTNTIDMETHSVAITELNPAELAEKNHWIGLNQMKFDCKTEDKPKKTVRFQESGIEGMDLQSGSTTEVLSPGKFKSKKDIKKIIKQVATKEMKKSKAYQLKNKVNQIRKRKQRVCDEHRNAKKHKRRGGKKGRNDIEI